MFLYSMRVRALEIAVLSTYLAMAATAPALAQQASTSKAPSEVMIAKDQRPSIYKTTHNGIEVIAVSISYDVWNKNTGKKTDVGATARDLLINYVKGTLSQTILEYATSNGGILYNKENGNTGTVTSTFNGLRNKEGKDITKQVMTILPDFPLYIADPKIEKK